MSALAGPVVMLVLRIAVIAALAMMVWDAEDRADTKGIVNIILTEELARRYAELASYNPHAHLLGKEVEARVYEGSRWERMVVVAVSWKGSVCVRYASDPEGRGRWIKKEFVSDRVREIADE